MRPDPTKHWSLTCSECHHLGCRLDHLGQDRCVADATQGGVPG